MHTLIAQLSARRWMAALLATSLIALLLATQKLMARHLTVPIIGEEALHNIGHGVVYGTLGALARCAAGRAVTPAWLIAVLAASFEEWSQQFTPGRTCCMEDALLNIAAISLAMVLVGKWIDRSPQSSSL